MIQEQIQTKFLRYLVDTNGKLDQSYGGQVFDSEISVAWFYKYNSKDQKFIKNTAHAIIYDFCKQYYEAYGVCPTDETIQLELDYKSELNLVKKQEISELLSEIRRFTDSSADFGYLREELRKDYLKKKTSYYVAKFVECAIDDPEEAITRLQNSLTELQHKTSVGHGNIDDNSASIADLIDHYTDKIKNNESVVRGIIPYPYANFNNMLGGMRRGEVIVVAADLNVGKSFLMHDIGYHSVEQGYKVACVELEMLYDQVFMRLCSRSTGIPSRKLEKYDEKLTSNEKELLLATMEEIKQQQEEDLLFIPAHKGKTVEMIKRECQRFYGAERPDVIVIDYITQMRPSFNTKAEGWDAILSIIQECKSLALEWNCVVLTAIHLNRQKNVQYASVEQRCDIVFVLSEDETFKYQPPLDHYGIGTPGLFRCDVTRNRNGVKNVTLNVLMEFATSSVTGQSVVNTPISNSVRTFGDKNLEDEREE